MVSYPHVIATHLTLHILVINQSSRLSLVGDILIQSTENAGL